MTYHQSAEAGVVYFLRRPGFKALILSALIPALFFTGNPIQANPRGGTIVHGDVNIRGGGGNNLQIRQSSNSAIIDWESFSIDVGELTQFRQPNRNAAVLNRVTGGDPSAIHGALKANGNVFVINPNGILVGAGGTIDVHGLVLSTLDLENGEFLAGGDMTFKGAGENVTNMGRINGIGGDVFLIGRTVRNSGSITASSGTVGLAAGEEVLLTANGNKGERLFVRSKGAGVSGTGILNDGTIEGAAVELKAHGNMFALAINNKGSIRATGAVTSGGKVYLRGVGGSVRNSGSIQATSPGVGSGGRIQIEAAYAKVDGMMRARGGNVRIAASERAEVGGTIDVSAATGRGGDVVIEGREVQIGSTALVDASGDGGGGTARIGGGFQGRDAEVMNADRVIIDDGAVLRADATGSGRGGNLIVWSDGDTIFNGDLSARGVTKGGFAEISGRETLAVSGDIDLTASEGSSGTLLLDPTNITISATGASSIGGSTISNVWLSDQLDAGNNVVISTNFGVGADAGNITVGRTDNNTNAQADRVQWYQDSAGTAGGTLSLLAMGDVRINTAVQSAGAGGVNVVAGWDGSSGLTLGDFDFSLVLSTMNDGAAGNDAAGLLGGSIYVGATNSRTGVAVGSRWGDTNFAGADLVLRGSTSIGHGWAQVGFSDNGVEYELSRSHNGVVINEWWGSALGNVQSKDYIALLGGTEFGTGDVDTLGLNAFRGAGWGTTGNITAAMSGRVDARGGTTASFVQIGHGGVLQDGTEWKRGQTATSLGGQSVSILLNSMTTRDGITIDPIDGRRSFFASTWRTNYAGDAARIDGDISVEADGDVLFMSSRGFDGTTDMLNLSVNTSAYALIGHGGEENHGSYHGDISVISHGVTSAPTSAADNNGLAGLGIQILGGRGSRSYAAIGHVSGYEGNRRSVWDQTRSGDVTVTATSGAIRLQAHNQAIRDGNINTGALIAPDAATPVGNASDSSDLGSYVQIGHGGQNSDFPAAGGVFTMPGGTSVTTIIPDSSATGNIAVTAGGTYVDSENADTPIGVLVRAGNRRWQHAMIGHGGTNQSATNTADIVIDFGAAAITPVLGPDPYVAPTLAASTGFNGNIRVEADKGSVIATGGDNFRADRVWGYGYNFVQVGHGGDVVRGDKGGTITVLAGQGAGAISGDIRFQAGRMLRDHALLGHGGLDSDGGILGAENSAMITVAARGDISFVSPPSGDKDAIGLSGDYAYWWFNNGSATGTPQTNQPGYWQTEDRFVQLGHGGYASTTVIPNRQDIFVTSGTGDSGNADGDADTGGITFVAGDMERNYAQLGHGGHSAGANDINGFTGDIVVNALGGGIKFDASILGAQAVRRATDRSLDGVTTGITTVGFGGGYEAYAMLGHGGYAARGVNIGDITINAWGGLDFSAAPAAPKIDQVVTGAPLDAALNAGTYVWVQLANLRDTAVPATATLAYQTAEILSNVVPGSLQIVLSDGRVITDVVRISSDDRSSQTAEANGLYLDGVKVGDIHYDWGIVRFNNTTNPLVGTWTGTGATASFQTAQGLKERAFVQLGHGGYDSDGPNNKANDLLSNRGDITINAGGDINFQGGAAHRSFAQLGHGGYDTKGSSGGNITIDHIGAGNPLGTVGGLSFLAGHGGARQFDYYNYAQLGHGGIEADGNHFGNIFVRGTENADGIGLLMKAGDRQDAYSQIGHGGLNARTGTTSPGRTYFGLNGDIDIAVTGDVALVAGTLTNNNPEYREDGRLIAQIGHGGYDADATNDNTSFFGQTATNPFLPVGTEGAGDGNWGHFGDISLVSSSGNISFMGGSNIPVGERLDRDGNPLALPADPNGYLTGHGDGKGRFHWTQLGHGGYATSGDHHGNIDVIAENGSVHVVGGMMSNDNSADKWNWAQIGHAGGNAQGNLGRSNETIRVRALGSSGDIVVAAGNGNRTQAMIGNGGINFDGSHKGAIELYAGRDIYIRGGVALKRVVTRIGEFQEMNGVNGGNANDIGEFNGYYGSGGLGYVLLDEAASAGAGAITKLIGDDIQPGTLELRLAILAPALFDANATPDFVDEDNGDGTGNIVENGNPANVVGRISYATGEIQFETSIVTNTAAQPDVFVNYDHRTGIRNDAVYANATVGHGGYSSNSLAVAHAEDGNPGFVNRGISGDIDVRAGVDASGNFTGNGGSISAIAGNDQRTYVQIGHGGMDSNQAAGHALSGAITTKADGTITFRGGGGLVDNQHIAFNYYGTGNSEVAAVTAAHNATVADPTRYATNLSTGTRTNSGITDILYAFAHIGHGGLTVHANGSIDNNSNNPLAASTPDSGHNGDIYVETASGNIDFSGGGERGYGHFAMIGHGGYSVHGNHYGDIDVISGADINFIGGGNTFRANSVDGRNFVQVGHGGRASTGNLEGNITVGAAGAVTFQAGDSQSDRSRVPYGAHVFVLNAAGDQDENHYNRTEGRQSSAMMGHGGLFVYGDKTGDIDVTAGAGINFRGGDRLNGSHDNNAGYLNFAQIGHGGYQSFRQYRNNLALPGNTTQADDFNIPFYYDGTQYVFDGTGQFPFPNDNSINAALGLGNPLHDGFSGNVTVTANSGNVSFQGGTAPATFAQIGHGGIESGGDHSGDLTVTASSGDILFNANRVEETGNTSTSTYTYAQVGHGGVFSSGEQSGAINLDASGEIRFKGGRSESYAMVGHGGRESHGTTTIQWGGTNPAYRQSANLLSGRNIVYRPGTRTGDITVLAGGDIAFVGGNANGDRAFSQIGHGGFNIHANPDPGSQFGDGHSGAINVTSTAGSLLLRGGEGTSAYAQIGHGGTQSFGNHGGDGTDNRADSDIVVQTSSGIDVMGTGRTASNTTAANYAQIGHGGRQSSFRDIEDIDGNRYGVLAPYRNYINPLTGTGNADNPGVHPLTPSTTDTEGVAWRHPDRPWGVQAQLGTFKGDITVRTTGVGADIRFRAANEEDGTLGINGTDSSVQLGHGGFRNFADIEGNITVESGGGLEFTALHGTALSPNTVTNHNGAFAQIGHGGYESGGKYTGTIDITTDGNILFRGADSVNGANAGYAQIGHGGANTWVGTGHYREALRDPVTGAVPGTLFSEGSTGDIMINSGGDIDFLAGRDFATYAQIGHGGYVSRDSHTGNIDITATGGIRFIASIDDVGGLGDNAGNNNDSWAQIGHGGVESDGSHSGNITVRAGEFASGPQAGYGLYFKSGNWDENYSQLGHGGYGARSYGNGVDAVGFSGDIDVEVNGDISFIAGTYSVGLFTNEDGRNYTQLGHGGYEADTSQDNSVVTGLVDGFGNPIGHHGDIRVVAKDGSINFLAGDINRTFEPSAGSGFGTNHYAQLGHGGASSHGNHYGNITVQAGIASDLTLGSKADGDVLFASGGSSSNEWADIGNYALLGHGGRSTEGNFGRTDSISGNPLETITVMAGRDITFTAERGDASAFVQLGHGGWGARGDHAANVQVFAERNLSFTGGSSFDGTPALGDGHFVSYGHGSRTDANNATINQDRAANLGDGANFNLMYNRVVPGSLVITIRLDDGTIIGTLSDPDGDGTLTADAAMTADFQDGLGARTIAAGTHVGNVVYSDQGTSNVTFLEDVNPGTTTAAAPNENPGDSGTANLWVQFEHGDQDGAYAMLGHGGWDSDNPNGNIDIGNKGNVSVTARTGSVELRGGKDDDTFAMIGHGGRSTSGANTGNITIRAAGDVGLYSGSLSRTATFIGHGGAWDSDGDHSGNILVSAGSGNLFTSLSNTKMAPGGWFDDLGDFDGMGGSDEIQFAAINGGVDLRGGNGGDYTAAVIGHGGHTTTGNFSGHIGVSSYGDINLISGPNTRAYTQIGHGGHNQDVAMNLSGDIHVISVNGNLLVKAGPGFESYALIGHGDDQDNNTTNSRGTRQGGIQVIADHITLDRSSNRIAWIGHTFDMAASNDNPFADQVLDNPADNLGGGYEVIGRSGLSYLNNGVLQSGGTITVTDSFRDRIITPNLKDGNFAMSGGNIVINTIIDSTTSYADPLALNNSVSFLSAGDIDVNRRVQAPGSGAVNLVAGANLAGAVIVDAPSRTGGASGTNLNFPQIDHLWNGNVPTGFIDLTSAKGDGLQWGNDNGFAISSGEFSSAAGEISMDAINNGGNFNLAVGSKSGPTNLFGYAVNVVGGNSTDEYAQIGFTTDVSGDPATGDVMVEAKTGGVLVRSGTAGGSFAQIGHGGKGGNANLKNLSGMISVRADHGDTVGNVSVLSGTGDSGFAQIGHGGRQNDGSHNGMILVIGEALTVTSGAAAAQIGHGGFGGTGSYNGDIFINYDPLANGGMGAAIGGGGALSITAGAGFDDYAQIGHGGVAATDGNRTGNIVVGQSASVSVQGGGNRSAYAQLGHGGVFPGGGALTGNIAVTTTGNVSVLAGNGGSGGTNGLGFAQLGHGGASASGTKTGDITINALGTQVSVAGGSAAFGAASNFGQIGHGGDLASGAVTGNIVIDAPNAALSITGGNQTRASAKVGHGGYTAGGTQSGSIDLTLGGNVNVTAGGDHSFSQIGHGGSLSTGTSDGAITVNTTAGNLALNSGAGVNAFTQIGHGGVGATGNNGSSLANGELNLGIAGNILMNAGGGADAYTQLGHGGSGAIGTHLGDICVHADGSFTINDGTQGTGTRAYAQVGHGGYGAAGNHSGEVTLVTGLVNNGGVSMTGGSGVDQYVQIGHGGTNAGGNLSGRIFVVADNGGDLVVNGGSGAGAAGSYGMIGHGDGHGTYGLFGSGTTGGTREGGIQYFVDGDSYLNAGTAANTSAHLLHRTNDSGGLNGTNYLGGNGYQYVVNGAQNGNAVGGNTLARENESTILAGNLGAGNIVLTNTGDVTYDLPTTPAGIASQFANHSFSFIVMATGNLTFNRSFQNAGDGTVALVAGWDGVQDFSSVNFNNGVCEPEIIPGSIDFNDCDRFGQNMGVLTIGSTSQTEALAVGSREGNTFLRGYAINVLSSNTVAGASTQIGFRADGSGDITGKIDVQAKQGGLNLQGGTADNAFVQIGHGTGSGSFSNNVTSAATVSVSFCEPGSVTIGGGSGAGSFAQIGNGGGNGGTYTRHGNVSLTNVTSVGLTSGSGDGAYTQIGNGGINAVGAITSTVTIAGTGAVSLAGGGNNAYSQIGAGGIGGSGIINTGEVTLTGASLSMTSGAGSDAYTQVGAGGSGRQSAITGNVEVTTTAGGVSMGASGTGVRNYAQIGAGGAGSVGAASALNSTTTVTTTGGGLTMNGTNAAYTQIGAGGLNADATAINGTVLATIDGAVSITGGTQADAYAQIGNGGSGSDATKSGNVTVSGTVITLNAGSGAGANTMIGNGGGRIQTGTDAANGSITGDVSVTATNGGIAMGAVAGSADNFVQIGAGGRSSVGTGGTIVSTTTVATTGGDLTLNSANAAYAQIGAGGLQADMISQTGNVAVTADGAITMTGGAGQNRYSQIGNGGTGSNSIKSGNTTVSGSSLEMTTGTGTGSNVLIGLGGGIDSSFSSGALSGNVLVTTTSGGVTVSAAPGNAQSFAQIGNGGLIADGNMSGTTTVASAGAVSLTAGPQSNSYARIGAGGSGVDGVITNAKTTVTGTTLTMTGGSNASAYTQIGAGGGATGGGNLFLGSVTGDVDVDMSGAIVMSSGTGASSFSQIGAGGAGINGAAGTNSINSKTDVRAASLQMTANSGNGAYVQVGAGGGALGLGGFTPALGSITGNVTVTTTAGGVSMGATGSGTRNYVQIGAGGSGLQGGAASIGAANTITSNTSVTTTGGGLTMDSTLAAYTQVGAGGLNADATLTGSVTTDIDGALSLKGGAGSWRYSMIGLGGAESNSTKSGVITVKADSVSLLGGTTTNAFAQIGHGGAEASGAISVSNIFVDSLTSILLTSGGASAYTQIGHGGYNSLNGTVVTSDILINSDAGTGTGDVTVTAGTGDNASAVIGHAGSRVNANVGIGDTSATANVTIAKSANVRLSASSGADSFAQIGNGGERGAGNWAGDLSITSAGEITLTGGSGSSGSSAMIGHGGVGPGLAGSGTKSGKIDLMAGGNVSVSGGSNNQASAQIGHGGYQSNGNLTGAVNVISGGVVSVTAGTAGTDSYAQIGHGGRNVAGTIGAVTGNILVQATGDLSVTGGQGISGGERYAQIGHASLIGLTGDRTGTVTVTSGGDITLQGGEAQSGYVQIGHGGRQARGDHSGGIEVTAAGSISAIAGATGIRTGVMIGHGGSDSTSATGNGNEGNIAVIAQSGSLTLTAGGADDGQVRFGHGGPLTGGSHSGDIVASGVTGITLLGGSGVRAHSQIGHGGAGTVTGNLSGDIYLNVNPTTFLPSGGGAVSLTGGSGSGGAYAQVGHGSLGATGNTSGLIAVFSTDKATVEGGSNADAFALIGLGGRSHTGAHGTTGDLITVFALNGVDILGGSSTRAFAQIGSGGSNSNGAHTGDVLVNFNPLTNTSIGGGVINIQGGTGSEAYAQIGLGGATTGSLTGSTIVYGDSVNVKVGSGGTAFARIGTGGGVNLVTSSTTSTRVVATNGGVSVDATGGGGNAYAQIGAGGLGGSGAINGVLPVSTVVTATGAVEVKGGAGNNAWALIGNGGSGRDGDRTNAGVAVTGSEVSVLAGTGGGAFAQIGAGGGMTSSGNTVASNIDGSVSVVSTTGSVTVTGSGSRAYAQIGHGGLNFSGSATGDLHVVSAADLLLSGGTSGGGYSLLGHGGIIEAGGFTAGVRSGNVLVRTQGLTSLTDNSSVAFLSHLGSAAVTGSSRLALVTGQLDTSANATGTTGMITNMIGSGSVEIAVTNGDLLVNGASSAYSSGNHLDLVASGGMTFLSGIQNAGSGDINVVAGWDGTTGLFESINVMNPTPIAGLSIEAASILADPAAHANNGAVVSIGNGSQSEAISVGSANGATNVFGDTVRLISGTAGAGLYTQLGYRGTTAAAISGMISVGSGAGGIDLQSSNQDGGFAQIGHGGSGAFNAAVDADISLLFNGGDLTVAAAAGSGSYAQVGHGGTSYNAALSGNIGQTGQLGSLGLVGGSGLTAYAQVGHGGDGAYGVKSGDITLEVDEATLSGGSGFRSSARIGHGGRGGVGTLAGSIDLTTLIGDINATAGSGSHSSVQIGHGGADYNGNVWDQAITLNAAGNLVLVGGTGLQSSALIGHGGAGAVTAGFSGEIVVIAGIDIDVIGGDNLTTFAQIGHGGAGVAGVLAGDISVAAGGDIALLAPFATATGAYAKIGHGDDMRGLFTGIGGTGTRLGDLEVAAAGGITMVEALLGHTNAGSGALSTGTVMVGVSVDDPANPSGGNLVADANSEFSGDEIRFYLPQRANNQIAAGAMMNGMAYAGGLSDPWPTKGAGEFANFAVTDSGVLHLNEHDSSFGSGPAPATAGAFAFYFDTVVQGDLPQPPLPPEPPLPPVEPLPEFPGVLDGPILSDWIDDQEGDYSGPVLTEILYEGFSQYGTNGEVYINLIDPLTGNLIDEEDILRHQLEKLGVVGPTEATASEENE